MMPSYSKTENDATDCVFTLIGAPRQVLKYFNENKKMPGKN